jgi:hypothetical protein
MTPTLDPESPGAELLGALSGPALAVALLALAAGALTYALPALGGGRGPRGPRLVRAGLVTLGMLLVWVLLGARGSDGFFGRLADLGPAALVLAPLALAGLTVWTYAGAPGASRRRVGTVLGLRLLAFLLAVLAMLRPSLGLADKDQAASQLWLVADYSASMSIADGMDGQTRWAQMLRNLRDAGPALERLRADAGVEVVFKKFAADVADFDPAQPGQPDGKHTDFGQMLRRLYEARDGRRPPRGLLVLSDGSDHGTRIPALAEAAHYRALPCPVHPFAYGKPTTAVRQNDVVVTAIYPEPSPVPVKGELAVRASVDAWGFANSPVRVRLFLEGKGGQRKEVAAQNETLKLASGNEVRVKCTAPAEPGEVKVTLRVEDPRREGRGLDGEVNEANNEMSTFVTVTKEGLSVLLVDKPRAWEPQLLCEALRKDARIRLYTVWLRGDEAGDPRGSDLFQFDKQQYDVIILGDVTARQVQAVNPRALETMRDLVDRGAGLVMLGGYATFGNGDWGATVLKDVLPVDLGARGQIENPVKVVPTEAGLRLFSYLMRLADARPGGNAEEESKAAWAKLHPLDGMAVLGRPKSQKSVVLAESGNGHDPVFVAGVYGGGRVLAFAGDTTYKWVRDPKTQALHDRFWRQVVVWLAKQEESEGGVWVAPDTRRLPARNDLGFAFGLRSKAGVPVHEGTFEVSVEGPNGAAPKVVKSQTAKGNRGTLEGLDVPGEYRVTVRGEGKDPSSGEDIKGEASARFLVYDDDRELADPAAGHDFLKKLAAAGGGQFHGGEELRPFLEKLLERPQRERPKMWLVPDWGSSGRSPFLVVFFVLFVAVLTAEWVLRRRWGMV